MPTPKTSHRPSPAIKPGQRFGKLVVLSAGHRYRDTRDQAAMVRCECGTEYMVRVANLKSKKWPTRSCRPCAQQGAEPTRKRASSRIRPGQRYGLLTVIERAADHYQPDGAKVLMWRCVCTCGREWTGRSNRLLSGKQAACGYHYTRKANGRISKRDDR